MNGEITKQVTQWPVCEKASATLLTGKYRLKPSKIPLYTPERTAIVTETKERLVELWFIAGGNV